MTTTTFADYLSRTADLRASERVAAPRPNAIRRFASALWKALEATGRHRARAEMLAFADRCEATQPELARRMRFAALNNMVD